MNSTEIAADLEDIVTCLSRAEVWDRTSAERAIDRLPPHPKDGEGIEAD